MGMTRAYSFGAACVAVLALWGCGREADKAARADLTSGAAFSASADARGGSARTYASAADSGGETAAPLFKDGKPLWASSRRRTAEDGAQRQFDRNGADFGAHKLNDYVAQAHAFVGAPPKGVLTAKRANGDVLYYDPKANVFAVADKDGAPRTMFKPRDGMAYWTQQQASLSKGSSRGRGQTRVARAETHAGSGGSDSGG